MIVNLFLIIINKLTLELNLPPKGLKQHFNAVLYCWFIVFFTPEGQKDHPDVWMQGDSLINTLTSSSSACVVLLQQSDEDVSQFDSRFTRQTPVDSPDDTTLSHSAELAFAVRLSSFSRVFPSFTTSCCSDSLSPPAGFHLRRTVCAGESEGRIFLWTPNTTSAQTQQQPSHTQQVTTLLVWPFKTRGRDLCVFGFHSNLHGVLLFIPQWHLPMYLFSFI